MRTTLPRSGWLGMPRSEWRHEAIGYLFASPWVLGFLLFTLYPLATSLFYSLTRYDLLRPAVWIGLANYREILTTDRTFRLVMGNTLYWVLLSAPLGVIAAFLLAYLLNTRVIGRSLFRAIFFFPSLVPVVVTAMVWQFLLNTQYGAINASLQAMNLPVIPFLSSPALVKPSLVLIQIWAQGSAMVIFLATLQDVPRSLYEAATVDGANEAQRLWHITIPICSPVILFNLVMAFISGFQYFTLPWLLTQGGPNRASEFFSVYLYRNAFVFLNMGKASALAWVLFLVIVAFTFLLFRGSGRFVFYGGESQ